MISYSPKEWFSFIFRIHKSETFKQLIPILIGVALFAAVIAILEIELLESNKKMTELVKGIATIYTLLGFTLSLLLTFRSNSAYDRWWEGRKQWGELTNASRTFASHMNAILGEQHPEQRQVVADYLKIYAYTLQYHLKSQKMELEEYENSVQSEHLKSRVADFSRANHQPIAIYSSLCNYVQQLFLEGKLNTQEIYHFKSELDVLMNVCGACERIKNTPIPFSYSVFLKKFIFFYVMLFPLVYCVHMSYYIIPVTVFILYVLGSIELIAEEIEDPFNGEANDLPTLEMAENIGRNVTSILT
jgi:putative membrane protein